jgi:hypothetical protein
MVGLRCVFFDRFRDLIRTDPRGPTTGRAWRGHVEQQLWLPITLLDLKVFFNASVQHILAELEPHADEVQLDAGRALFRLICRSKPVIDYSELWQLFRTPLDGVGGFESQLNSKRDFLPIPTNSVIDLRTLETRPRSLDDFFSFEVPFAWNPRHPHVTDLSRFFVPDPSQQQNEDGDEEENEEVQEDVPEEKKDEETKEGKRLPPQQNAGVRGRVLDYAALKRHDRVSAFFAALADGDPEAYLHHQITQGFMLTGEYSKLVFCDYGEANSGKSTLSLLMQRALGPDAAVVLDRALLIAKSQPLRTSTPHLTPLMHSRYGVLSETQQGDVFAEGNLKRVTSDVVTYRTTNGSSHNFRSRCKLNVATNYLPGTRDRYVVDRVIIRLFAHKFPSSGAEKEVNDRELEEFLADPVLMSGALSWIIRGAHRYYNEPRGIVAMPESARRIHARWADPLKTFLDDNCMIDLSNKKKWIKENEFHERLSTWYFAFSL